MKLHILTKIRITVIIAIAVLISWQLNSGFQFNNCRMPINIVFTGSYGVLITYLLAAAAATAIAFFLGGRNNRYIAPLAGPFVLVLPAVFSDNINNLLIGYQGQQARASMFRMMFADTLLWYAPVLASLAVVVVLGKYFKASTSNVLEGMTRVKIDRSLKQGVLAAGFSSLIIIFVLPFICRADVSYLNSGGNWLKLSTAVSIGQQAFAVTLTFLLAVMASHQLFSTSGRAYLPVPVIVAGYFYLFGDNAVWDSLSSIGVSPVLVPPKKVCQTVLPITFAVFGSLGIAWGYWNSYKLHFARLNNLIKVK